MASNLSKTTRDHEVIRRWAEERGGKPACVRGTGSSGDVGMLRIDFPGYGSEASLQPINWDDWFAKFDERGLALIYEEQTASGQRSSFNKLVSAGSAAAAGGRSSGSSATKTSSKKPLAKKSSAKKAGGGTKTTAKKGASSAKKASTKKASRTAASKSASRVGAKKKSTAKKSASKKRR